MAFGKKRRGALHIKGSTAGTSNELSFSVLDATKQEMDRKHGEARRIKMPGRLELFTVSRKHSNPIPDQDPVASASVPVSEGVVAAADADGVELADAAVSRETAARVSRETQGDGGSSTVSSLDGTAAKPARSRTFRLGRRRVAKASNSSVDSGKPASSTLPKLTFTHKEKPALSTEEGRERKVKERKRRRRIIRSVVGVAASAALVGACYVGFTKAAAHYEHMQRQVASAENIQANLADFDDGMKPLDEALSNPLSTDLPTYAAEAQAFEPTARDLLQGTDNMVSQLLANAQDQSNVAKIQDARAAVESRSAYLEAGYAVLEQELVLLDGRGRAAKVWDAMLSADAQARSAAADVNSSESKKLESAKEKAALAFESFQQAQDQVQDLADSCYLLDPDPYVEYVQARQDALEHMADSIGYLLEENISKAQESAVKYEKADAAAVKLAKKLPQSMDAALFDAYTEEVSKDLARYKRAREKATVADQAIAELTGSAGN